MGKAFRFAPAGALLLAAAVSAADLPAEKIGQIVGAKAAVTPDGVVRVGWPRTDVRVTIDGLPMKPFAGLGSWAAFQKTEHGAMVMGDTVVFQDEVDVAVDAAFAHGLEVTALHNHFFFDEPKVYFMHIGGTGDAEKLAAGVKGVWDAIKNMRAASSEPATRFDSRTPQPGALNGDALAKLLGAKAESQEGIVKFTIGREAAMHGLKFGGSMGLATWAAFTGSDALAVVDGDIAMTANEVQPVLHALRKNGIHIVALHNHMVSENPHYFFVHFWGKGEAEKLGQGLEEVLAAQHKIAQIAGHQ
jgi:hypothetical protein